MKPPPITEDQFLRQVIQFAKLHGWQVSHFRPGMDRRGKWKTAVSGDGVGWPDLVLVRERVIFVETKSDKGKLRPEQVTWIELLRKAKQEVYVWRPSDWDSIERVLTGEAA